MSSFDSSARPRSPNNAARALLARRPHRLAVLDGGRRAALLGAVSLLLVACAVSRTSTGSASPPAASLEASPSAVVATPTLTPSPSPTATPRADPPVAASDPDALASQIVVAERAVRDPSVTGADLAWFGHLQQLTFRRLAARPEWHDPVLSGLPSDIRGPATANADATADLRATVIPGPDLPTAWRIVEPAALDDLARYYREARRSSVSRVIPRRDPSRETRMGRYAEPRPRRAGSEPSFPRLGGVLRRRLT